MAVIALTGTDNVRDLGGLPVADNCAVKPGLFFRGSSLHAITPEDTDALFTRLGIKLVVDVRCGWELEAKPDIIPDDVEYRWIPFYDQEVVGVDYKRPAANTIVDGNDFACDPQDFYRSLANPLTAGQIGVALHAILDAAAAGRPVYFHCSGGKDRAGITALLVLSVLGADDNTILDDYLLTNIARDRKIQQIFERFRRLTSSDEQAWEVTNAHRAVPENLDAFRQAVVAEYGSFESFLSEKLQITPEYTAAARAACTEPCE